ncbi:MAG: leucine-rich repeat protein, partial [Oscillospiraceae bacterium]|nr:leucine-rich repeat protein [Oscillospiraceae bacterium]
IDFPPGTEAIADGVFSGCTKLISVDCPPTLTKIGDHAFEDCVSLNEIEEAKVSTDHCRFCCADIAGAHFFGTGESESLGRSHPAGGNRAARQQRNPNRHIG